LHSHWRSSLNCGGKKNKKKARKMPDRCAIFAGLQESEVQQDTAVLDVFAPEAIEAKIDRRIPCQAKPTAGIQGTGPFEIYLPSERSTFIDPASFRINGQFKILQVDSMTRVRTALPAAENGEPCHPSNLLTKSIFKDVIVEAHGQRLSINSSHTYAVKAYVTTCLSYGRDAAAGQLRCSYYLKDTPGQQDNFTDNAGGQKRYKFIQSSRAVEICDNIHTELTTTNRYLVPGVDFKFKFIIEDTSTFLTSPTDEYEFAIEFQDLYLTYDRVLLKEDVHESIERGLSSQPAIYPITRTEIRCKGFATGLTTLDWNNAYQGILPEQIVVCMNLQEAADGKATKSLFNFHHFGMTEMSLIVNSMRKPATPLKFNFPAKECLTAYRHFFDNCGVDISNLPALIEYEDFLAGSTIIPFDLTTDKSAHYHGHEKKEGTVSIEIKLGSATTQAINMYVLCVYRDYFYVYGNYDNRKVSLTYPSKI
jgi:hypothetical protein